jgi:hypothetical protein
MTRTWSRPGRGVRARWLAMSLAVLALAGCGGDGDDDNGGGGPNEPTVTLSADPTTVSLG